MILTKLSIVVTMTGEPRELDVQNLLAGIPLSAIPEISTRRVLYRPQCDENGQLTAATLFIEGVGDDVRDWFPHHRVFDWWEHTLPGIPVTVSYVSRIPEKTAEDRSELTISNPTDLFPSIKNVDA